MTRGLVQGGGTDTAGSPALDGKGFVHLKGRRRQGVPGGEAQYNLGVISEQPRGREPAEQGAGAACFSWSRGFRIWLKERECPEGWPEVVERPPVHSSIPQTAGASCPVALPSF